MHSSPSLSTRISRRREGAKPSRVASDVQRVLSVRPVCWSPSFLLGRSRWALRITLLKPLVANTSTASEFANSSHAPVVASFAKTTSPPFAGRQKPRVREAPNSLTHFAISPDRTIDLPQKGSHLPKAHFGPRRLIGRLTSASDLISSHSVPSRFIPFSASMPATPDERGGSVQRRINSHRFPFVDSE
jgi:hypothetical protein